MITRENFKSIVHSIDDKDKKRILNNESKEYVVLDISSYSSTPKVILSNDNNCRLITFIQSENWNGMVYMFYAREVKAVLQEELSHA
jgi:hypothetical protein